LNPDIDRLDSLELIEQGDTLKAVSAQGGSYDLRLQHAVSATHGTWFVLRARGKHATVRALSAPVYVIVDGQSFWKPAVVPSIVKRLKERLHEALEPRLPEATEEWETQEATARYGPGEQELLKQRVFEAEARYDEILNRAVEAAKAP